MRHKAYSVYLLKIQKQTLQNNLPFIEPGTQYVKLTNEMFVYKCMSHAVLKYNSVTLSGINTNALKYCSALKESVKTNLIQNQMHTENIYYSYQKRQ